MDNYRSPEERKVRIGGVTDYTNRGFQPDDEMHSYEGSKLQLREQGSSSSSGVESNDPECNDDTLIKQSEFVLFPPKPNNGKKMSNLNEKAMHQNRRNHALVELREKVKQICQDESLNIGQLQTLLSDRRFCQLFFSLFDEKEENLLDQTVWFAQLKEWTEATPGEIKTKEEQNRIDLVDLLEAITYLVCQENAVSSETFYKIFSTRGVATKVMRVLSKTPDNNSDLGELMSFVMELTNGSKLGAEAVERLRTVFKEHLGQDKQEIVFEEFKKIVPSKNEFFVRRIFNLFDNDKSGTITLTKFIETVQQFAKEDDDAKIEFLFQVYDTEGDGVLQEENFRDVLKACMTENGMDFEDEDVDHLANVLFMDGCKDGADHMTLDDFKEQLQRQEGLVKNMGIMITKWLVPPPPSENKKPLCERMMESLPKEVFTKDYWRNNKRLWVMIIFLINIVIMCQRVYYFSSFAMLSGYIPNFFYLTSRACGKALIFNSVLILVLVLRKSITTLTRFGFSKILPLDNNIYLHKVVGTIIFVQAVCHTIAHLLNFAINIAPNPVRFIQLTYRYWEAHFGVDPYQAIIQGMSYMPPPGCELKMQNESEYCPPDSFPEESLKKLEYARGLQNKTWVCQSCNPDDDAYPWTYADWILTSRPHVLGLMPGMANPTGVALITILFIMFVCSLPFIRRRGHFEIFYFTHLLYWAYFALLVMHCPDYWKWLIGPFLIWIAEMSYRVISYLFGAGKTIIKAGVVLPSRVTNLIIERPPGFNFSAGDWVFIKIPAVASSEWHPFTISSAPEVSGQFTLHIRGVGQWTNSLHALFKAEHERQALGYARQESTALKIQATVRRKYKSVKVFVDKSMNSIDEGDAEDNFVDHLKEKSLEQRKQERMERRQVKLEKHNPMLPSNGAMDPVTRRQLASVRYLSMRQAKIVKYDSSNSLMSDEIEDQHLDSVLVEDRKSSLNKQMKNKTKLNATCLEKPLEVYIDGPFGSPSSNIYRAEHAVLVGTGIGITPFASILQSIMHRYMEIKQSCPSCNYKWTNNMEASMFNLKKVDFIWINRDQKSFEWFVNLLSQLEIEQREHGGEMSRFLDMHMYVTSALQRTDMKAVALQLALDILHQKEDRDLITGLKSRTNAGRPNWNKVFTKLKEEKKGQVTVFYCGNPMLARTLKSKCSEFGFKFRKEVF